MRMATLLNYSSRSVALLWSMRRIYISIHCLNPSRQTLSKNVFLFAKRGFSSSDRVAAKKGSVPAATSQSSSRKLPAIQNSSYQSFAEILKRRSSPTLLYEATSSIGYIIRVYFVGLFCIAYGCYQYYTIYLFPPTGVDIPYLLGVVSAGSAFFVALFGSWILFRSYRVVQSITALPQNSGPLLLRIDSASVLRLLRPRPVTAPHSSIFMSSELYIPEVKLTPLELALKRRQEVQMREKEKERILTLPFRQANYWTWRGFQSMKHVFFGDKFIYLTVKGKNGAWKLNKEAAWVLDSGRALDRLTEKKLT